MKALRRASASAGSNSTMASAAEMTELLQQNVKPVVVAAVSQAERGTEPLMTSTAGVDACDAVLGHMGWWQIRTLLIVGLVKIPSAWHMASILFTAPSPAPHEYWCARPARFQHLEGLQWKNISHPKREGTHDSCNVFSDIYEMAKENSDWSMLSVPENATIQPCSKFEYNTSATFVSEWHLVCSREMLVNVSQFFYLFGVLIGGLMYHKLSQRTSPRSLLMGGMMLQIVAGLGVANSTSFELQGILRFVSAVACTHMFSAGYAICIDNCGSHYKSVIGAAYEFFWSIGVMTLAIMSYLMENWRDLQYCISVPTFAILFLYRWIPNSPRWLINHGEKEAARALLEKAQTVNGDYDIKIPSLTPSLPEKSRRSEKVPVTWSVYIAHHITWATTVVTYYGALLNVKNLGAEVHVNTAVAGAAEVAGVLLSIVFLLKVQQKWKVLSVIKILGGGSCYFSALLPLEGKETWGWSVLLMLAMLDRISISCSLALLTTVSSELIPRPLLRQWSFSTLTAARVCLLSATFIGTLAMFGEYVSLCAFGTLTVIGGIADFFLEPPKNQKLETDKKNCSKL